MKFTWNYLFLLLICIGAKSQTTKSIEFMGKRPTQHLKWTQAIKGEFIPTQFYDGMRSAEASKQALQNNLRNFLEHLQKNLTLSDVFTFTGKIQPPPNIESRRKKLNELSEFFYTAADVARCFARDVENSYEIAKNTSYNLLLQLRQIPSTQPMAVKILLTNYFAEMEFFHIMFSEIIDEALEYTQNTLFATENTFKYYADVQRFILQNWKLKEDLMCGKEYMEFLKQYSAQIFKCAIERGLNVSFDVFAMTEITSKYVMRQLEFRVQRLFNCLYLGNYEIRCKFLQNAEKDFEILFSKLEELETFFDIKMKKGRVSSLRFRRDERINEVSQNNGKTQDKCIPKDFPRGQLHQTLRTCFINITDY